MKRLNVGELILSDEPIVVSTVLGSCVSVCLFDLESGAGGIVHYAHAHPPHANDANFRYGSVAIPALIEELERMTGRPRKFFRAKLVGGARDASEHASKHAAEIGAENVAVARAILDRSGISVVGEATGGRQGRKLLFHSATGRVQVAMVGSVASAPPSRPVVAASGVRKERATGKRKVLIVDDSRPVRTLLERVFSEGSDFEIVGLAASTREASEILKRTKPDVITLDVHMPEMTGVEWLEKLLPVTAIPVVMVTSSELRDGNEVFRALEIGAVDYIQKPTLDQIVTLAPLLRAKVKEASFATVRLKRRAQVPAPKRPSGDVDFRRVLVIGASTGGTEAIKDVICALPDQMPPILIVQHIPPVFSKAFADRLNALCGLEVKEAEDRDELRSSRVLIAPGGKQMKLQASGNGYVVRITDDLPVNRHKPSVDYLFQSVATILGRESVGVILTGMGADGAKGLLEMKKRGAQTIAQDEASCVVYGMPRAAFEMGAVDHVASLEDIPGEILARLSRRTPQRAA